MNQPRFFRELLGHPLVLGVLALKILAAALFVGPPLADWFTPFVGSFAAGQGDPWAAFLAAGQPKAFPYPPGMLYAFALPRFIEQRLLGTAWDAVGPLQLLLMRLPLLAADLAIFAVLGAWFRDRLGAVRLWWWCSPLVFYVAYVHGQLDLLPTALFLISLFLLEKRAHGAAFAVLGLALSTKNHLWIALPFLLLYLRGRLPWLRLSALSALTAAIALGLSLPYALRPAYAHMVLGAEEQGWIFSLGLPVERFGVSLLLCPAALLFILARFAAYPRHNWDLTMLYLGLAFSAFVLLVPPMPGWYVWSLPFVVYYACRFGRASGPLLLLYSAAYLAYFALGARSDLGPALQALAPGFQWPWPQALGPASTALHNSLYFTLLQSSLAAAMLAMYSRGVRSNDVYGARSKPLMLGIAGDSAAGKDTLTAALTRLFGAQDVLALSGDDYHRWERGHAEWGRRTHLDPASNRLHQQQAHVARLASGQAVLKAEYDHGSGRFSPLREIDPRKNVIVQGLHTFVLERLRQSFDLKVFLEPDERLRRFWKRKRDSAERGAADVDAVLRRRQGDRRRAILPQRKHADLLLRLEPARPQELKGAGEPALSLDLRARNSFDFERLAEGLQSLPGLEVALSYEDGFERVRLRLKGSPPSAADLQRLAPSLVPGLADLVGMRPQFSGAWTGLMSLIVIFCLGESLQSKGA